MRFHRSDGASIEDNVPRLAIAACAEALLKQRNAQFGFAIDETIAFSNRGGWYEIAFRVGPNIPLEDSRTTAKRVIARP
jgi:hypothetical protein